MHGSKIEFNARQFKNIVQVYKLPAQSEFDACFEILGEFVKVE